MATQICSQCHRENPSYAVMCWDCYNTLNSDDRSDPPCKQRKTNFHIFRQKPASDGKPIVRMVNTFLHTAIRDNASQIRLLREEGGVSLQFLIAGKWREQMKIPPFVWLPVLNEIATRAENGPIAITPFDSEASLVESLNTGFGMRMVVEPSHAEITLTRL